MPGSGQVSSYRNTGPVRIVPGLNADRAEADGLSGQPVFWLPNETPDDYKFGLGKTNWGLRFMGVLRGPCAYGRDTGAIIRQGQCYARVKAAATALPGAYLAPDGGSTGYFYVSSWPTSIRLVTDLSTQTSGTIYGPDNVTDQTGGCGVEVVPQILIKAPLHSIFWLAPAAASATGVHAAVTDTGSAQTITTGITNPAQPRNITATSAGTAGDIKAIQVIVTGTNYLDEVITETLPVFTENSGTTVAGALAFKTITSWYLPAHDGTGATTSLGWGDILGLPDAAGQRAAEYAALGGTVEGTLPTLVADADEIEKNTCDPNSALNATQFVLGLWER